MAATCARRHANRWVNPDHRVAQGYRASPVSPLLDGAPEGGGRRWRTWTLFALVSLLTVGTTHAATDTLLSCGFENGWCGMETGITGESVTRQSGDTSSSDTGPSGAYSGSYYVYSEATSTFNTDFDLLYQAGDRVDTVTFAYSMYGGDGDYMGSLKLQGSTDCSSFTTLWSKSGNQGSSWKTAEVDVTGGTEYTCMQFLFTTGTYFTSDIAIDDITMTQFLPTAAPVPVPTSVPKPAADLRTAAKSDCRSSARAVARPDGSTSARANSRAAAEADCRTSARAVAPPDHAANNSAEPASDDAAAEPGAHVAAVAATDDSAAVAATDDPAAIATPNGRADPT
eukprot:CAMPEP_0119488208 /NCGR_PEP_ID=MMETSP1344-20130328/14049_1 /TAXON_ID=236787 /ORGANISM="Florenciella parvula, Strain CCMP2471" /LENGTH=340 /DNA_ID=CAMNT_0007523143 /DNA_START=330 /DNA_END=1347 /DNA_ORIENTATION=+